MEGTTSYIKSLDGVRAIAILLVMTFHANLTHFGWIGVQLFFVLSGYLITGILWKDKSSPEPLAYKFKKFWTRRSLRIFPLYYGFLFFIGLVYLAVHFPSYFPFYFPYAASYTINFQLPFVETPGNPIFHHLWSLSIEEQFYLLFPLIILLCPRKVIKYFLLAVILLSPLIRYLLGEYYKSKGFPEMVVSDAVNFNTLCQLDAFCTGGIISVFSLQTFIKKPLRLLAATLGLVLLAGTLNYMTSPSGLNFFLDLGYYHYFIDNYQHIWHYTVLNLLFASLIIALISIDRKSSFPLRRLLENRWMVRVGKVSYGMYIYHWMIWAYLFSHFFVLDTLWMRAILFLPYVIIVYVISEISFKFYEGPFIRLKDRFFPSVKKNV